MYDSKETDLEDYIESERNNLKKDMSSESPFNIEELSRYLILCQLIDKNEQEFENTLRNLPLEYFTQFVSFETQKPYVSHRNIELYIRTAIAKKNLLKPDQAKKYWEDIYSKLKKITKIEDNDKYFTTYEGQQQADQLLYTIVQIKLVLIRRQEVYELGMKFQTKVFCIEYLNALVEYINDPLVQYYSSKELKLFFLWQIMSNVQTLSNLNHIHFDDYKEQNTFFDLEKICKYFCMDSPKENYLKKIDNWSQLFLLGLCIYTKYLHDEFYISIENYDKKNSEKTYDGNNIFDIKLREYCIINFSWYKIELSNRLGDIADIKIPGLVTIFMNTYCNQLNLQSFYTTFFRYFNSIEFMIPSAICLYINKNLIRCESVIKQILEKKQKSYRDDIAQIMFIACFLYNKHFGQTGTSLLFAKDAYQNFSNSKFKDQTVYREETYLYLLAKTYHLYGKECKYATERITHYAMAENYYEKCLKKSNNMNVRANFGIGVLFVSLSRLTEAKNYLCLANKQNPFTEIYMMALAIVYAYIGDYNKSISILTECLSLKEVSPLVYIVTAFLKYGKELQKQETQLTQTKNLLLVSKINPEKSQNLVLQEQNDTILISKKKQDLLMKYFSEAIRVHQSSNFDKKILSRLKSDSKTGNLFRMTELKDIIGEDLLKKPEVMLDYEKILLHFCEFCMLTRDNITWNAILDCFHPNSCLKSVKLYYEAMLNMQENDLQRCHNLLNESQELDCQNFHTQVAYAELYFKNPKLVTLDQVEAFIISSLTMEEHPRNLYAAGKQHKKVGKFDIAQKYLYKALQKDQNSCPISIDCLPQDIRY